MATRKIKPAPVEEGAKRKRAPIRNPEAQEQHMINLAVKLAERQLEDGTASSQVITHYLKLATAKEKSELEKAKAETELVKAKVEAIKSQAEIEILYKKALDAMKSYSPSEESDDEEYEDYD